MPSQTDELVHDDDIAVAADFLDYLRENSLDPPGVSRASFGPGERMAHARLAEVARGLGLVLQTDFVGNLFVTQPGQDPSLPVVMIGSHLDAVPHGGNFDGAAGVAIGLGYSRAYAGTACLRPEVSRCWRSAPKKCHGSRLTILAAAPASACYRPTRSKMFSVLIQGVRSPRTWRKKGLSPSELARAKPRW